MDQNQSFKFDAGFLNNSSLLFIKIVFALLIVYVLILIINFLRDKFINQAPLDSKVNISDLLSIFNKLFFYSGFGFIIANFLEFIFSETISIYNTMNMMNLKGAWSNLTFGIVIIFMGLGFKAANKIIKQNKTD